MTDALIESVGAIKLWLDDRRPPCEHGRKAWTWVRTLNQAAAILDTGDVVHLSLDYDLGASHTQPDGRAVYPEGMSPNGTGADLVSWMKQKGRWPSGRILIHSTSQDGAWEMLEMIEETGRTATLTTPCGELRGSGP